MFSGYIHLDDLPSDSIEVKVDPALDRDKADLINNEVARFRKKLEIVNNTVLAFSTNGETTAGALPLKRLYIPLVQDIKICSDDPVDISTSTMMQRTSLDDDIDPD